MHSDICSTLHPFSGQRLCDLRLQCPHTWQQHGGCQHQPKALWEETHLSGGPSGMAGVLSQPATACVSSTIAEFVSAVWWYYCGGAVMQVSCCPHGSVCSLQTESDIWRDAWEGCAKWRNHVGLQRSGGEIILQLLQVPQSCTQLLNIILYLIIHYLSFVFVFITKDI